MQNIIVLLNKLLFRDINLLSVFLLLKWLRIFTRFHTMKISINRLYFFSILLDWLIQALLVVFIGTYTNRIALNCILYYLIWFDWLTNALSLIRNLCIISLNACNNNWLFFTLMLRIRLVVFLFLVEGIFLLNFKRITLRRRDFLNFWTDLRCLLNFLVLFLT